MPRQESEPQGVPAAELADASPASSCHASLQVRSLAPQRCHPSRHTLLHLSLGEHLLCPCPLGGCRRGVLMARLIPAPRRARACAWRSSAQLGPFSPCGEARPPASFNCSRAAPSPSSCAQQLHLVDLLQEAATCIHSSSTTALAPLRGFVGAGCGAAAAAAPRGAGGASRLCCGAAGSGAARCALPHVLLPPSPASWTSPPASRARRLPVRGRRRQRGGACSPDLSLPLERLHFAEALLGGLREVGLALGLAFRHFIAASAASGGAPTQ